MIEDDIANLEAQVDEFQRDVDASPLGAVIDLAYNAKSLTSALNRLSDRVKDAQKLLLSIAKEKCEKNGLDGAVGHNARLTLAEQEYATVNDWGAVYQYMQDTGNFQLLQQRVATTRVKELHDAGEEIPGIVMTPTVEPTLRKL